MWHKIYFEENIAICRCTSWIRTQFGGCDGDGKTVFADYCVHHYNIIGDFLLTLYIKCVSMVLIYSDLNSMTLIP